MTDRPEVRAVIHALLAASEDSRRVPLDAIGDALGAQAFTQAEIERVVDALEAAGRAVIGPAPGALASDLRAVLVAARAFAGRTGRNATVDELAAETGLPADAVRAALGLARVLGR